MENLVQYTTKLLGQSFEESSTLIELREEHILNYLELIEQKVGHNLSRNNIDSTIKGIMQFYKGNGMSADVSAKDGLLYLSTAITNPDRNLYVKFLVKFIKENYTKEEDFNDAEKLLTFARDSITSQDDTTMRHLDEEHLRSMIKSALRYAFDLKDRDGIFFYDNKLVIKDFDYELVSNNEIIRSAKAPKGVHIGKSDVDKLYLFMGDVDIHDILAEVVEKVIVEKIYTSSYNIIRLANMLLFYIAQELTVRLEPYTMEMSMPSRITLSKKILELEEDYVYKLVADTLLSSIADGDDSAKAVVASFDGQSLEYRNKTLKVPLLNGGATQFITDASMVVNDYMTYRKESRQYKKDLNENKAVIARASSQIQKCNENMKGKQTYLAGIDAEYESKKEELAQGKGSAAETKALEEEIAALVSIRTGILTDIEAFAKEVGELTKTSENLSLVNADLTQRIADMLDTDGSMIKTYEVLRDALSTSLMEFCEDMAKAND